MSDDYLWDGSGEPDPDVQRLELLLGRFRHARPAPDFHVAARKLRLGSFGIPLPVLAAAAVVLLAMASTWLALLSPKPAWEVESLDGTPKIGSHAIRAAARLEVGQWLETDDASRAKINIGKIGEVEVEPNTRVRLVQARRTEHRLALARGIIHALIWAPPRLFSVETPSAVAVDLGCSYTLEVNDAGEGRLRVSSGWVAFELNGRESFVPEGAMCITEPGIGPGTPYYEDAAKTFQEALARLDFENGGAAALDVVLSESRQRDALTLWHLLSRLEGADRARVYERMVTLVVPPEGVTREGILRGDRRMLDLWWNQLGLEDTNWWRFWKSVQKGVF